MHDDEPSTQPTVTERDRRLIEQYLGVYLSFIAKSGPNSAVANNARNAAENMVAAERQRCVNRVKHWFGGDSIFDRGYKCVWEIENGFQ